MKKILIVSVCITFCIILCSSSVLGFNTSLYNPSGGQVGQEIKDIGNAIIGILQVVGTIFAVAMLLYLGMRLMLSSPSERANVKAQAVPYIVGAVLLFSIVNILGIVYDIMQKVV